MGIYHFQANITNNDWLLIALISLRPNANPFSFYDCLQNSNGIINSTQTDNNLDQESNKHKDFNKDNSSSFILICRKTCTFQQSLIIPCHITWLHTSEKLCNAIRVLVTPVPTAAHLLTINHCLKRCQCFNTAFYIMYFLLDTKKKHKEPYQNLLHPRDLKGSKQMHPEAFVSTEILCHYHMT